MVRVVRRIVGIDDVLYRKKRGSLPKTVVKIVPGDL